MKTISKKTLAAFALFFSLFMGLTAKAQITVNPYPVGNTSSCTFVINWYAVRASCVSVCDMGTGVSIGPGLTNIAWSTSACPPTDQPLCDFKFEITQVGASLLSSPITCKVTSGSAVIPTPAGSGCPNSSYNITMTTSGATFN